MFQGVHNPEAHAMTISLSGAADSKAQVLRDLATRLAGAYRMDPRADGELELEIWFAIGGIAERPGGAFEGRFADGSTTSATAITRSIEAASHFAASACVGLPEFLVARALVVAALRALADNNRLG